MAASIKPALKKFVPIFQDAQSNNLNEADTVLRITKFFEDVLGYDALTEISREAEFKGKYVDITIKLGGVVKLLVEAKAAGVILRDRHIEQAEAYASRNNFRWVLLTNGVVWNLYHLTFEEGIERERVFSVDLSADHLDHAAERLSLLSRLSVKKGDHEEYWQKKAALSPAAIGKCLFCEDVLMLIRREIRKGQGFLIDPEDLASAIHGMLSPEAREQIGPLRIRGKKGRRTGARVPRPVEGAPESSDDAKSGGTSE